MYVYGEEIFIINYIMDFILSAFICRIVNAKKIYIKSAICAFIGGIYAVGCLYLPMGILSKFTTCIVMAAVINRKSFYDIVRTSLLLLFGSFICSGAILMSSFIKAESMFAQFTDAASGEIIMGCFMGIIIFSMCSKILFSSEGVKENIINAKIRFGENEVDLRLLNDSGNLLRSHSGKGIVIINKELFLKLCPCLKDVLNIDNEQIWDNMQKSLTGKISFVKANSIGGESLMICLKADELIIKNSEYKISPVFVCPMDIADERIDGIINVNIIKEDIKC